MTEQEITVEMLFELNRQKLCTPTSPGDREKIAAKLLPLLPEIIEVVRDRDRYKKEAHSWKRLAIEEDDRIEYVAELLGEDEDHCIEDLATELSEQARLHGWDASEWTIGEFYRTMLKEREKWRLENRRLEEENAKLRKFAQNALDVLAGGKGLPEGRDTFMDRSTHAIGVLLDALEAEQ